MHRLLWLALVIGLFPLHGEEVLYSLDFSAQQPGDAMPWLKEHGFELKFECDQLHPTFDKGALHLSADHPVTGLFSFQLPGDKEVAGVKHLRLTWGVDEFPDGADWENGVNRVAIAVMVSFGHDRLPSGLPLGAFPEPYFISTFIGSKEVAGKVYTGTRWKEGGRYVCVKSPHPNDVVTYLEVDDLFARLFGKSPTPPVSAIGIQMNTKDTAGRASAFVKRIELLGDKPRQ